MSSLMDTQKIIHIVSEVILLGVVSYYLNGKIKSVKHEVKDLKAKLVLQEESFTKHVNTLYSIIDKMNNERKQMAQDLMSLRNFLVPRMNLSKQNQQTPQQVAIDEDEDDDHHEINLQQTLRQRRPQNTSQQAQPPQVQRQQSKVPNKKPIVVEEQEEIQSQRISNNPNNSNRQEQRPSVSVSVQENSVNLDDELGDELKDLEEEEELELKDSESISNKQPLKKN